jgi:protein Tex
VKVKVLSVDIPRHRISLTMRLRDEGDASARGGRSPRGDRSSAPRTAAGDSGRPRSAPRQGDRQGGAKRDPRSGGPGAGGRGGAGGDRGGAPGGDRRGGGAQGGGAKRDPRNAPQAPANGAMAEALRRAGLVNDKGAQPGSQDRRSNRP